MGRNRTLIAVLTSSMSASTAWSQVTTTYDYDANGHLVSVVRQADDPSLALVSFSLSPASAVEGTAIPFKLEASRPVDASITVSLQPVIGQGHTASSSDLPMPVYQVAFDPGGPLEKFVDVATNSDPIVEGDETFELVIIGFSGPAESDQDRATGTIVNDDSPPVFSITPALVAGPEGDSLGFDVVASRSVDQTTTVQVQPVLEGGTSAASSDLNLALQEVTFDVGGATTKSIQVQTVDDQIFESDETFAVKITQVLGPGSFDSGSVYGTIQNDDTPPTFRINDRTVDEGSQVNFTVTMDGESAFTHSVSFSTSDGSAIAGQGDYNSGSGVLSFEPGRRSRTVSVQTILDDYNLEPEEHFFVDLTAPPQTVTFTDARGRATIRNIDNNTLPAVPSPYAVSVGQQAGIVVEADAVASDTDGDPLTFEAGSVGNSSIVTIINHSTSLEIMGVSVGSEDIAFAIVDGRGGRTAGILRISVTASSPCGNTLCLPENQ